MTGGLIFPLTSLVQLLPKLPLRERLSSAHSIASVDAEEQRQAFLPPAFEDQREGLEGKHIPLLSPVSTDTGKRRDVCLAGTAPGAPFPRDLASSAGSHFAAVWPSLVSKNISVALKKDLICTVLF